MWEILSENEKIWITMNEDNSQIFIHFKVTDSKKRADIDEDYWIELPYLKWNQLVLVVSKTKNFSNDLIGIDMREGDINVQWIDKNCLELDIGKYFKRYFNAKAYVEFAWLLEKANSKIIKI